MIKRIDYERCNNCGRCAEICPMDTIRSLGHTVYIAFQKDCMTCFLCEEVCKPQAIYVSPERGREVVLPF